VRLLIVGWGQGSSADYFSRLLASMSDEPMLGLSTGSEGAAETITPRQIALGAGDDFLLAINQAIAQWGKSVFVRPLAEMNGHWNAYSAFDRSGAARGPDHSTAEFRKAFARIYLLLHGGPGVNARLRSLGLPPVHGRTVSNRNVQVIWNPQGYGAPDLPGNAAQAYYPGDSYVDVVGDDLYDIGGKVEWAAADALYKAHPGKPFAIPEWGLWSLDDPAFVAQMGAFLSTHPRTVIASYYSGRPGSIFDLASKPRSLAEYRRAIAPLGH
jgi:beta-mannanase